jgi:hypothetical protein
MAAFELVAWKIQGAGKVAKSRKTKKSSFRHSLNNFITTSLEWKRYSLN